MVDPDTQYGGFLALVDVVVYYLGLYIQPVLLCGDALGFCYQGIVIAVPGGAGYFDGEIDRFVEPPGSFRMLC